MTTWPRHLGTLLDEADAIQSLIRSTCAEWTDGDRIAPYAAGDLIDLLRDGVRHLVYVTATLEALATWNPSPGLLVLPNASMIRDRIWAQFNPVRWTTVLDQLALPVIAREPLHDRQAVELRCIAEELAGLLGPAVKRLDAAVRDRWDMPATRTAEHVVSMFLRMEQAEQPGPAPLHPTAPWPAAWWTIAPHGPASSQAIRDDAHDQQRTVSVALTRLTRSRSRGMRPATITRMLTLGAAGMDAIRRIRVLQDVLLFLLERTVREWPIITPVSIESGLPWAISGDQLPLLEAQRTALLAAPPSRTAMITFLQHVADVLAETMIDLLDVEALHGGNQVERLDDAETALARLVHGAAAPPRPAMPWLEEIEHARALRQSLRIQAVQVREAVRHGMVARPKRRRTRNWYPQTTPEGQACLDAIRAAMPIQQRLVFRAAVLRQLAQRVQAGESPTIESVRPRWIARTWWAWNESRGDMAFQEAVREASRPLDVRIFDVGGTLRCGLASAYTQMATVLSDAIRDASRVEDMVWALGIDTRPWAEAAASVYAAMEAAEPYPKATVCCDCGQPRAGRMESHQCRACERRAWDWSVDMDD